MKNNTLEEAALILQEKAKHSSLSIEHLLHMFAGRGSSLILILLSLPFCQPIQIPGLSVPFGVAIAFIGVRMAFGKRVWLPKRILKKKISQQALKKMSHIVLITIRKLKWWIHPRLDWLCHNRFMKIVKGLSIFILGILLALPLPIPLSNLAAAWAIFFIALGALEDDGLFVLIGYVIFLSTIAFFALTLLSIKQISS